MSFIIEKLILSIYLPNALKKKVNIKSQFLTSPFGATIALMKSATELRVYSLGKVVFLKGGF